MASPRLLIVALGLALMAPIAGCGQESPASPVRGQVESGGVILPAQLLGLQVQREEVGDLLEQAERSYIAGVGLFSLREKDLVRATLQVSKFNRLARPRNSGFRASIIGRIGQRSPQQMRVSDTTVYVSIGTDQTIFAWFKDRGFYVLSTHRDYEFPRTLLRRVMQVDQDF